MSSSYGVIINGYVESDHRVSGAKVTITKEGSDKVLATATTAADGTFTIVQPNEGSGTYILAVANVPTIVITGITDGALMVEDTFTSINEIYLDEDDGVEDPPDPVPPDPPDPVPDDSGD